MAAGEFSGFDVLTPQGATMRMLRTPAPPSAPGRVTGKTAGVKSDIIACLQAVADHYRTEIRVTSGLRTSQDQADEMWKSWNAHLKKGTIYHLLKMNPKRQQELDALRTLGTSEAKTDFSRIIGDLGTGLSPHLRGEAVDIALNTPSFVLKALIASMPRYLVERDKGVVCCDHFDTKRQTVKLPTVDDRKQWPA